MKLSEAQKQFIRDNFKSNPNLLELTRQVFEDPNIDGRSKEGRAVREFLAEENLEYKTTKRDKVPDIQLTDQQIEFIKAQAQNNLSAYQIAEILFPDINIKRFCKEHMTIVEFLREYEPAYVHETETALNKTYNAPKIFSTALKKINSFTMREMHEDKLTHDEIDCIESLMRSLSAPRFVQVISNYNSMKDRELFEAEFVRATWDKPDLTSDEINLYINVCVDYINLKNISSHIEKLNTMFNEVEDQQDMTVRLAEVLKSKTDEYDKCEKRMESLIKKLNGDRAERLKNRRQDNATIISLVKSFQVESERRRMIELAEMQKKLVEDEVERLDNMESWKARILGISKHDAV
jgi:hypothetical protein